jgi:HSP20 family protein
VDFTKPQEIAMKLNELVPAVRQRALSAHPFVSLRREMDRLFEDFTHSFSLPSGSVLPNTDILETEKEIRITAELPGLEDKDVKIDFADNVLTIKGEKKTERDEKEKDYRLMERSFGSFSRSLELPVGVKADDIKASIAKGVLTVTVAKPAPAQVKKIEVKSVA